MAEIYINEIHEAVRMLEILMNQAHALHSAIHTFAATAQTVQVPGFIVIYNIRADNAVMLASLQDIRSSIALTTEQIAILIDTFELMRAETEETAARDTSRRHVSIVSSYYYYSYNHRM